MQEIPVPKYVLWRMFHDIETGRVCDSLVRMQQEYIEYTSEVIQGQDSLIQIRGAQIDNLSKEISQWEGRHKNQAEIIWAEKAEVKRWKFTTFIGGGLIILLILL